MPLRRRQDQDVSGGVGISIGLVATLGLGAPKGLVSPQLVVDKVKQATVADHCDDHDRARGWQRLVGSRSLYPPIFQQQQQQGAGCAFFGSTVQQHTGGTRISPAFMKKSGSLLAGRGGLSLQRRFLSSGFTARKPLGGCQNCVFRSDCFPGGLPKELRGGKHARGWCWPRVNRKAMFMAAVNVPVMGIGIYMLTNRGEQVLSTITKGGAAPLASQASHQMDSFSRQVPSLLAQLSTPMDGDGREDSFAEDRRRQREAEEVDMLQHWRPFAWENSSNSVLLAQWNGSCACGCGLAIDPGVGTFQVSSGKLWRTEHFRCDCCHRPLQGGMKVEEPVHGKIEEEEEVEHFIRDGRIYCIYDYILQFGDKCTRCGTLLEDDQPFSLDPQTGSCTCVTCLTLQRHHQVLQANPVETIENKRQAQRLFAEVKEGLGQRIGLQFNMQNVELEIVDKRGMEGMKSKGRGRHRLRKHAESLGFTIKLPRREEHNQLGPSTTIYEAKKVVVQQGLSRLQTGAVMAHELMHCWLAANLSPCSTLAVELEEGLCELAAYIWLLGELQKLGERNGNEEERQEVASLLRRMEHNVDRHQGLSFHRAFHGLQGRSFQTFLKHVKTNRRFPSPPAHFCSSNSVSNPQKEVATAS
ncbi:hypothetical protein QOT17_014888 [Balamuthia mandrillaris]